MNPGVTSKAAIMQACRELAARDGLSALSMRAVSRECGIALGTLYNYYADKDELLIATVGSIWREIFHMDENAPEAASFPERIERIFGCIREGARRYPGFLNTHSAAFAGKHRAEARIAMDRCFDHMRAGLLEALEADPAVNPAVFTESFTAAMLAEFTLDHLLLLLIKGADDCTPLIQVLRQALR